MGSKSQPKDDSKATEVGFSAFDPCPYAASAQVEPCVTPGIRS